MLPRLLPVTSTMNSCVCAPVSLDPLASVPPSFTFSVSAVRQQSFTVMRYCVFAFADSLRSNNELCGHWTGRSLSCDNLRLNTHTLFTGTSGVTQTNRYLRFAPATIMKYFSKSKWNMLSLTVLPAAICTVGVFSLPDKSGPQSEINCCKAVMPNIKILFSNQISAVLRIRAVPSQAENYL